MMLSCENRGANRWPGVARGCHKGPAKQPLLLVLSLIVDTGATKMPALAVARASWSHSPGWRMGEACTASQGGAIRTPPVVLPR
jgi:hypothetical protein